MKDLALMLLQLLKSSSVTTKVAEILLGLIRQQGSDNEVTTKTLEQLRLQNKNLEDKIVLLESKISKLENTLDLKIKAGNAALVKWIIGAGLLQILIFILIIKFTG